MRPISGRLPLHWLARWHSCPKFQLPLPHPRYPAPRHLHLKERGPDPGPLRRRFHLPLEMFSFPGVPAIPSSPPTAPPSGSDLAAAPSSPAAVSISRRSRRSDAHIGRPAVPPTRPERIHGRRPPIFRMKFFPSRVFRVCLSQVFPNKCSRTDRVAAECTGESLPRLTMPPSANAPAFDSCDPQCRSIACASGKHC